MRDSDRFNDLLAAIQAQRDSALNANVLAHAEIAQLKRTLAERDATIKALEAKIEKLTLTEVAA